MWHQDRRDGELVGLRIVWDYFPAYLETGVRSEIQGYVSFPEVMPLGVIRNTYLLVKVAREPFGSTALHPYSYQIELTGGWTAGRELVDVDMASSLQEALDSITETVNRLARLCNLFRGFAKGEYGYAEAV